MSHDTQSMEHTVIMTMLRTELHDVYVHASIKRLPLGDVVSIITKINVDLFINRQVIVEPRIIINRAAMNRLRLMLS